MQWDGSKNAGFSEADETWLTVNPNYKEINVKSALEDKDSLFYTYQHLITLRQKEDWLVDADFELLDTAEKVFAYKRTLNDDSYLVVVNVSDEESDFELDFDFDQVIISNTEVATIQQKKQLAAWDAFCVKL